MFKKLLLVTTISSIFLSTGLYLLLYTGLYTQSLTLIVTAIFTIKGNELILK